MRAEPLPVLKLLFQNPEAPRSVLHSLRNCAALLRMAAPAVSGGTDRPTQRPLHAIEKLCERLRAIDWAVVLRASRAGGRRFPCLLPPRSRWRKPDADPAREYAQTQAATSLASGGKGVARDGAAKDAPSAPGSVAGPGARLDS